MWLIALCFNVLQKRLQPAQVFGAKSTIRGQELGTASSVAFTPLQGLEIVNPLAAEKKQDVSYSSASLDWECLSFNPPLCPSVHLSLSLSPLTIPRRQTMVTFPQWLILLESRKLNLVMPNVFNDCVPGGSPSHVIITAVRGVCVHTYWESRCQATRSGGSWRR